MACTPIINVAQADCTKGACSICGTDWFARANEPWMGCTSLWAHPLISPNNHEHPCWGSSKHTNMSSMDMLGGCLHCVPITLQWSRATIHTMCNMCIRFGTIGFSYNDMWNTKAGIMYVYSWMSAMWVIVAHPAYVSFEDTLAQSKRCFFVGNFFCQGHHKWQWIGPTTRLCEDRRS